MSNFKIIKEAPLSMNDLKKELKDIKKRDGTLNFRAEKTDEYINSVATLSEKEYKDLEKEISELNVLRLKDSEMVKILDVLPKTEEEVKLVLSANNVTLKKEDAKKIADIIAAVAK